MSSPDVLVIGAGIAGVCAARELSRRGASVLVLDRRGVAQETTGVGEGNVLCADKDAGPELELARLALGLYAELEAELGPQARIRRKGALIVHPLPETWEAEPARVRRLADAGVDAQLLDVDETRELEPQLLGDIRGASFFPGDLQCDPRQITRALARELTVRAGCEVESIAVQPEGRVEGVKLAGGERLVAGSVVLCAGPWSAPLARTAGLHLPLEPRKGQLVLLRARPGEPPLLRRKVVDGSYLLSVAATQAARQVSTVVETSWKGDVVVGSSRERCGFEDSVDDLLSLQLRDRAARLVPALADLEPVSAWVGFRPWLPDLLPAVGPSRAVDGLWLSTGHEGAGVALGPVSGRALAQAMTGEEPLVDLAPFDPDRF